MADIKTYLVYGLQVDSELDLKPLQPLKADSTAQVHISFGPVSKNGLDSSRISRVFAQINETQVWLDIPDVCRMLISNGNHILIDACENADMQSIRLYVMGSGIGAILHQRGFLVLHANAIALETGSGKDSAKGAVLFAGISGSGKSTTAAVFHQRGFQVISDDVVAVDSGGEIFGGFPQIKLWEDTLGQLDISKQNLDQIRLQVKKYSFPLPAVDPAINLPIKAMYFLTVAKEQNPGLFELFALEGIDKFNHLKEHTYRRHLMEGLGLKPQHMKLCADMANSVHMARIIRPDSYFNAPELVDFVIQDLTDNGVLESDVNKAV